MVITMDCETQKFITAELRWMPVEAFGYFTELNAMKTLRPLIPAINKSWF